jgi:RNA polymerase sigma-70 factor (ECF subfamily)
VDISVLEREASEHHRDSPYQHVEATERQRVVHECLQDLPEMVRDLIHLHYWQDLSVEQIAARLQRPAATVRSCLYRGRRVLYRTLAGRGFDRTALSTSTSLRRKGGPRPGRRLPERATVAEAVG